MYTIDDQKNDLYEEEDYESTSWNNNRGLIFKIIIIVLCIIVLIWLIMALKRGNNSNNNNAIHVANTEKIRLAAEDFFFLKNNKEKVNSVSLARLKNEGLISDLIDANNKECNNNNTNVSLDKQINSYKMTIKLSCSTKDEDEIFYYHRNTLACLNCSGKTNMTNDTVVASVDEVKDNNTNTTDNNEQTIPEYSCVAWSDWQENRVNDVTLDERVKVLVQGVKYGIKTEYSDWSEYTTTPITSSDTVEVETKVVTEDVWSEERTDSNVDLANENIKIISKEVVYNNQNNCSNGYVSDNICYSNNTIVGNLTYKEYNSGNYKIKNEYCKGVKTLPDKDGVYLLTYIDCEYNKKLGKATKSTSYTLYTYQELEKKDVTYYRYRTISTINEPDVYTDTKYEEKNLPDGFVKVDGTEEKYYSYKLNTCEK